ncbi:MAG: exo-alpha-sialidase [Clostridia bacterium]|nr:exo-alpha-sialidase [Clostridia bacterium]
MIIEKSKTEYSCCRIPGLALTQKGTLLAYYECRKSVSDWAQIDLKIIRSTDGGESFETVLLIHGNRKTLNNPMITVKGSEVHFFYCENYKKVYHRVSFDDGKTFGAANDISAVFENAGFFYNVVAIGPGHGIVHGGKIILPVWIAYNEKREKAHHPSFISTIYSDDGESWNLGEIIGKNVLINPSECALAVNKEGNVIISIRNENAQHMRAFAISKTGFDGWGSLHFNGCFPDPVCMGSMCFANGKIYHINCESKDKRENLTVKISKDSFKTFERIFVDTVGGYSDIVVKDDTLYVLYERDIENDGLYFKKISLN